MMASSTNLSEDASKNCSEDVASDLSDYDVNNEIEEVDSDITFVDNLEGITTGSKTVSDLYNFREVVKEVGEYVVVNYEGTFQPRKITKILDEGAVISTMRKSLKSWQWPTHILGKKSLAVYFPHNKFQKEDFTTFPT
ncbi:hypothetical protein FQA39_LY06715 [Lamprigera yunnana]|nr:hypothetical protein FQA39_LY06715 [Lamprigera yunnana]